MQNIKPYQWKYNILPSCFLWHRYIPILLFGKLCQRICKMLCCLFLHRQTFTNYGTFTTLGCVVKELLIWPYDFSKSQEETVLTQLNVGLRTSLLLAVYLAFSLSFCSIHHFKTMIWTGSAISFKQTSW